MSRNMMEDDREMATASNGARTLVLVGRAGNGKSATANSILGSDVFKSKASTSTVTSTCKLQRTVSEDGQIINVVDTPGLFDSSTSSDFAVKELARCITLAEEGIHAVLLVFSVKNRLSQEEESALRYLQAIFGDKITDYMIIVFTGGDDLEDNEQTLDEYLAEGCPEFLKEFLQQYGNRLVLFDNKTNDENKKVQQVRKLLSLVDSVVKHNGGKPYTNELFKLQVETKIREKEARLKQQLAAEQAARLKTEKMTREAQNKSGDEIRMLRKNLEEVQRAIGKEHREGGRKCNAL